MKIMFDSNILISAGVFKSKTILDIVRLIKTDGYTLVLSDTLIGETQRVIDSKLSRYKTNFTEFFKTLDYEVFKVDETVDCDIEIRDPGDKHVILSALQSGVDILITGDKDFYDRDYRVRVMTPAVFLKQFGKKL